MKVNKKVTWGGQVYLKRRIETSYIVILLFFSICLIGGYFSYAIFTVQEEKTNAISIITGTLNPTLTSTDGAFANNQIVVPASTTKEITIKLTNNNNRDAKFNFYYKGDLPIGVEVGYTSNTKNIPPDTTGVVINQGESEEYTLKIVNNSSASFTLQIGSDGGLFDRDLSFPSNGQIFPLLKGTTGVETLLAKANDASITNYADGDEGELFVFSHTAGKQQTGWTTEELTDYRYVGRNAKNYVLFNDEWWYIVGVFTVEDEDGNKEKCIKLMRFSLGGQNSYYKWDSTDVETSDGKNRWSDSQLQKLLNPGYETEDGGSLYYNKKDGYAFGTTSTPDFTNNAIISFPSKEGLTETARSQIADVKWYLGAITTSNVSAVKAYQQERGTTVYKSKAFPRETNWIGKVGLIYPSDYGYTFGKGMDEWCYDSIDDCNNDNALPFRTYMYKSNMNDFWTITPSSADSSGVYLVDMEYGINCNGVAGSNLLRPSVYLKPDIQITSGDGSASNPYTVE